MNKKYKNLKKGTKIGLIIGAILSVVGLGFVTYNIISILISTPVLVPQLIRNSANFVMFIAIIFYSFVGYKKPHGNLLRGLFFTFGVIVALNIMTFGLDAKATASVFSTVRNTCGVLAALIIVYVSGRLNKIEKNKKLLVLAGLLKLTFYIMPVFKGNVVINSLLGSVCHLFILFALCFAYVARYEEHKAAGLADKADVEEK